MKPYATAIVETDDKKERLVQFPNLDELNRFQNAMRDMYCPVYVYRDQHNQERYIFRPHIVSITIHEESQN